MPKLLAMITMVMMAMLRGFQCSGGRMLTLLVMCLALSNAPFYKFLSIDSVFVPGGLGVPKFPGFRPTGRRRRSRGRGWGWAV